MVYDPLIGDLVAATATIPWLFQYARDAKVSETSKENYRKCIELLESMPDPSPRSIHKVRQNTPSWEACANLDSENFYTNYKQCRVKPRITT